MLHCGMKDDPFATFYTNTCSCCAASLRRVAGRPSSSTSQMSYSVGTLRMEDINGPAVDAVDAVQCFRSVVVTTPRSHDGQIS